MTKEMIISANRHETRVAILEDEQLVEVFFQRANEYSLAGSIHKGRVTRVLPGMQSAFVDVGLERDAFLYVTDFLEDSEEFEAVSTVEEAAPPPPAPERRPAIGPPPPPRAAAPDGSPGDRDQERDFRGGRRSRRRRGRGPGGFPDSKYAPALPVAAEREPAPAAADDSGAEDAIVLPGESLAKYRERAPEPPPIESRTHAPAAAVPPEAEDSEPVETQPEAAAPPEEIVEADSFAEEAAELEAEVSEAVAEAAEAADAAQEAAEAAQDAAEAESRSEVAGDEPEPEAPGESQNEMIEGQRSVPVSLTARLRDQGVRSMHRMPRRMRGRDRRGGRDERGRPQGPGDPQRGPRPERPAPGEQRAERGERSGERREPRPERPVPLISDLLKEGQEIVVQIAKEPLGQKGARITSHIALPGRFVVFMPTLDHLGVSRKVGTEEERYRLKKILLAHREGMSGGFIVRTAGEGKSEADIAADMTSLYNLWLDIRQKAERRPAPCLLHADLELMQRVVRDHVTDQFRAIWVDNEETYENTLGYVERFQPAMVGRVKLWTRNTPVFDAFNITSEMEKALRPKVWLKSGGYIVINQTEALVAIDVNTGKYVGKSNRLEDTIVKTNLEAVREIARQMRLRDLGGIIVVDFIDMDEKKSRQRVMQAMEEAMRWDKAPYKILQFNDFGLVAITRKRVKQSLERSLCSPCPYCEGAGYVKGVGTIISEILTEAQKVSGALEGKEALLRVHPDVAKMLKSREARYMEELEEILRKPVLVTADPLLHHEKFDLT